MEDEVIPARSLLKAEDIIKDVVFLNGISTSGGKSAIANPALTCHIVRGHLQGVVEYLFYSLTSR
jgi:hypothetical protein